MLCVCLKKDQEKFEREKTLLLQKIANENEVNELEALIDSLTVAKEIYAGGHSLEKDRKFKQIFKKFKNDLARIEVGKVQSEQEIRMAMFTRKKQTIKDKRALFTGGGLSKEKRKLGEITALDLDNI